jgi:hypothetical protein
LHINTSAASNLNTVGVFEVIVGEFECGIKCVNSCTFVVELFPMMQVGHTHDLNPILLITHRKHRYLLKHNHWNTHNKHPLFIAQKCSCLQNIVSIIQICSIFSVLKMLSSFIQLLSTECLISTVLLHTFILPFNVGVPPLTYAQM